MDVMQAILERRSVRKYRPDPVSDDIVNEILEAARWAPSWANTQCWRFVVVKDEEVRARLAATLTPETNRAAGAMREAPIVIVACAELGKAGFYKGEQSTDKGDWFMFDVALAMQNLALAAHAKGLGTVHTGLFDAKEVGKIIGVPEGIAVVEMTPLGYPAESPTPTPRKGLTEIVFRGKYGES